MSRRSPHILLAEEEQNLRHSMALMLKQAGCVVSVAAGILEAVDILRARQWQGEAIDLLIVDLGDASRESCRTLVEWFIGQGIAVPYLVIVEEMGDRDEGFLAANGCLACISKPFEPEALLAGVCRFVGRSQTILSGEIGNHGHS